MRGEDFSFDYLCDTLPSSSFRTVSLDFDFYTNPQIKLFMQFEKRLLMLCSLLVVVKSILKQDTLLTEFDLNIKSFAYTLIVNKRI